MSAPGVFNDTIVRGDTYALSVLVQEEDGTPIAITGRTYTAKLRLSTDDTTGTAAATFTCTITDGPGGALTMSLTDTVTAALSAGGSYLYDLQENASGTITTIFRGTMTVDRDITR